MGFLTFILVIYNFALKVRLCLVDLVHLDPSDALDQQREFTSTAAFDTSYLCGNAAGEEVGLCYGTSGTGLIALGVVPFPVLDEWLSTRAGQRQTSRLRHTCDGHGLYTTVCASGTGASEDGGEKGCEIRTA